MADQPDTALDREYAETAARVRRFLLSEYELEEVPTSSSDYPPAKKNWRAVWRIPVRVPSGESVFLIAVPATFPRGRRGDRTDLAMAVGDPRSSRARPEWIGS